MTAVLTKTETGYTAKGGRYVVEPKVMGDSPRNKGQQQWQVRDTKTGDHRVCVRLYQVREWITSHSSRNH